MVPFTMEGRLLYMAKSIIYRETTRLESLVEDGIERSPDSLGGLGGVNTVPDTLLLVVFSNRGGLLVEGVQTLLQGLSVVIRSLDERLAGNVILHGDLGRATVRTVRLFPFCSRVYP